jgi:hypothetical protein
MRLKLADLPAIDAAQLPTVLHSLPPLRRLHHAEWVCFWGLYQDWQMQILRQQRPSIDSAPR